MAHEGYEEVGVAVVGEEKKQTHKFSKVKAANVSIISLENSYSKENRKYY